MALGRLLCSRGLLICILHIALFSLVNSENVCKKGCPQSDDGLLKYAPGNAYEYTFDSLMVVTVDGSIAGENDDIHLKINGNAKVFAEGNCGYSLQVNSLKVTSSKEGSVEKKFDNALTKPVHFTMSAGKLEPEICVDESDDVYSLNIKRAIISLFQVGNKADNSVEVDVFGQCPTRTTTSKDGSSDVVSKFRNLNDCAYREQLSMGIVNGIVNEKADLKSSFLLQADYSKESKIVNGLLQETALHEEYRFAGLNKDTSGVKAKVSTSMKLKTGQGTPGQPPAAGNSKANIIFQKPSAHGVKNIASLKTVLSKIVKSSGDYIEKDNAQQFSELIHLMRESDLSSLTELSTVPHPNKALARKVYLDALFRTGTSESAKAIIKQIAKLDEKEKFLAMLSLNLVQDVDKETVVLAQSLFTPNAIKETFIAVGNLVSKYCEQNDCSHNTNVDAVSKKFGDVLKHCKVNSKKEEDRVVYALKGIGNSYDLARNTASNLIECSGAGRSMRIRVAAAQAFSAASCEDSLRQKAVQLLSDSNEDSELRIEAYLAAVECPTAELSNSIADIVNNEKVYQVGSFIASHLRAIRDSTDSKRQSQRYYLGNIRVTKHFPKNIDRFSYNNEVSYRWDALGISASADYKLIYSQHGFLPRSTRFNLTAELFGTNFNVLETSVRQENIESILEYYLGPKGLLNKDFEEIIGIIEGSDQAGHRSRRSIADDSAKFSKKYKNYGTKSINDLNLDVSLKMFGSELMFLSLGDNIPNSLDEVIKLFSTAFDKVKKELLDFRREFRIHSLFLDAQMVYPTGLGMPLELSAQGFAANMFDVGIQVDVDAILGQNWQRAKYQLKIAPSVDVNVDFRMGFNAYLLKSGIRVKSNLHSATGADTSFKFVNENGFNMEIELPREKLELLDFQVVGDFYVSDLDKPTKSIPLKAAKKYKPEHTKMCFDQLRVVGVNLCFTSDTVVSNKKNGEPEPFILAHPYGVSLYIESEKKYVFNGQHIPKDDKGNKQWKLDFSTPGSKESHDTTLAFVLGTQDKWFTRFAIENPQYHFAFEAGFNNDDKELVLYGQYESNDAIHKNKIGFEKNGNEYKPIIAVQGKNNELVNNINGYRADGRVVVQKSGDKTSRYNFENFQVLNKQNEKLTVNGWADVGPTSFVSELRISPEGQSYFVKSNFKLENGLYEIGAFVNDEKTPENVIGGAISAKIADQVVNVAVTGKVLAWEFVSANNIEYTKPEGSNTLSSSKFNGQHTLKNKGKPVSSLSVNGYTEGDNKFGFDLSASHGKQSAKLSTKLQAHQRAANDYILEVNGKVNKHSIDLLAKCEVSGNHYVVDNTLTTSWGTSVTAKGQVGQRFTPQDINVDLHGQVQLTTKDKPSQWLVKVIGSPEKTSTDFKLSRENNELIKLNAETQHPQDKISAAKVNVVVKNFVNMRGDFKVAKNGKGEFAAVIETQKPDSHKVDVSSKFHVQAPKYDIETTVTLDAKKVFYIKSETQVDKSKVVTKNIAEVLEKKWMLDANVQLKGNDWRMNGEQIGTFTFTCPMGHVFEGSIKRKLTTNPKTGIANGELDAGLILQIDGKKRSIDIKNKLEKMNIKTKEISLQSQVSLTDYNNEKIDLQGKIKHLSKGDGNKMLDINLSAKGSKLEHPADFALTVDEYDAHHANYRFSGTYGNLAVLNVDGKYSLRSKEAKTYNINANLQMPQTSFKTLQLNSNGKLVGLHAVEEGGVQMLELHFDERTGDGKYIRLNSVVKGNRAQGDYNLDFQTDNMENLFKIDGSYHRDRKINAEGRTTSGMHKHTHNVMYGSKFFKIEGTASYSEGNKMNLEYKLDSSSESAKSVNVRIESQKLENDAFGVKVDSSLNGNAYSLDSKIYKAPHKHGVDISIHLPNSQKPITVVALFEVTGERKCQLTAVLDSIAGLDFESHAEAFYKEFNDFYVTAKWNSKRLNFDNYDLNVQSKADAISFNLKNSKETILQCDASYGLKKEKNKAIIEGQGQMQYRGKTHNANFKLIRQTYDAAVDKEIGFSYTFNGNFGPKNGVSTFKITNKDFNMKLSICEEKKQCTNLQFQSIVSAGGDANAPDSMQHSVVMLVDLRELGYPYEFEFQSKAIRQGFKVQYSLDSNVISNNNLKYQLNINISPSVSKAQIKLPSREMLLEMHSEYPQVGEGLLGHYEHSIVFYIDKARKPNDVTKLISRADISGVMNGFSAININGEVRFEHPNIRPLSVSGKADFNRQQQTINMEATFDLFRLPEQQITAASRLTNAKKTSGFNCTMSNVIRSDGLAFQYKLDGHAGVQFDKLEASSGVSLDLGSAETRSSVYLFASKERAEVFVFGMNEPLLEMNAELDTQKYRVTSDTKIHLLGNKVCNILTELQPTWLKVIVKSDDSSTADFEVKLAKELRVNIVGAGKQLLSGRVALDGANFLQTTYDWKEDDFKAYLEHLEKDAQEQRKVTEAKLKEFFKGANEKIKHQIQVSKDSAPDFSKLTSDYDVNFNEIMKELEADPALKNIIEAYRTMYEKLSKVIKDSFRIWSESYEKLHKAFMGLYEKLETVFANSITPAWQDFLVKYNALADKVRIDATKVLSQAFKEILKIIEKYGPTLRSYSKAIHDTIKPYNEALQELYKTAVHTLEDLLNEVKTFAAKLPSFEALSADLKTKLKDLKIAENIFELVNNVFDQLYIIPQSPETTQFLQKIQEYLQAKIKSQSVNDGKIFDEIISLFWKALRSLEINAPHGGGLAKVFFEKLNGIGLPSPIGFFAPIPNIMSLRFSGFNFLLNENWEEFFSRENLEAWFYPDDFELRGHIADGKHIFTFDGVHYTFPGTCKYILAQDVTDNNFTVIAQQNNGKLKSITLADRDGSFLEVNDMGVLKMNGNQVEYPVHVAGGMHAWRKYYSVWLLSEYGVQVVCTSDLKVCHVDVNGFYTSKVRGLLGNGNAEPYDDFILPDGTIAADSSSFANAYGLGKCAPVSFADKSSIARSEICDELFGFESPLAYYQLLLDQRPYRAACDAAVESAAEKDREATACTIAMAYASALKLREIVVTLPATCLKCSGAAGQRDLHQEFTVKVPNNKADIVFVVDGLVSPSVLKNLISPLVTEIRETLKTRGFTDAQIGVIAYNESQRYPALLTSGGGKINYQGDISTLNLDGPKNYCDNCFSVLSSDKRYLEAYEIIESIFKNIAPQSDELAYFMALKFPFRAGAAKSIIDVRHSNVDSSNWPKMLRQHVATAISQAEGTILHSIAPIDDVSLEGVPAEKIIGFNSRLVATLDGKDAKRRQKLQFKDNVNIDLTLNSGGWVFSTKNFDSMAATEQKKVLNQISSSVADIMLKTEIVSDCKCEPVEGLFAQHRCLVKSSNFVPNKKPKAA